MPSLRAGRPRPGGVAAAAAMEPSLESPPLISRTASEVLISRTASEVVISRTAEVLYMLSHGAQLEHPHMINVHYSARQPGPTLRDVKARLVALRGKGMPDSFSWSYKRKYRNTFIWCDLFDDDLIVPLPGSEEYVLKAVKLFDVKVAASKDDKAVAVEPQELPRLKSPRTSSPCPRPSSRHLASKPERLHVEDDVSSAIKKSLLLINIPPLPADVTPSSTNLLMSNLKGGGAATEALSTLEHSDVSTERSHTNAASQTAHVRELHKDVTTDCNFSTMSKKDETTSVSPPRLRRKATWEGKDVGKSSSGIYEETVSTSGPDDPFLYGVLRKATKLGSSFRPRLCRGVDVIESTRIKTKLYYRSKAAAKDQSSSAAAAVPELNPCEEEKSKPLQGFASLKEYFESKELSTRTASTPAVQDNEEATPLSRRQAFGNEALDASYRKTMEVLAKLPNSRGASRVHTGHDHVTPQRRESKGNKQQEMMIMSLQNSKLHDPRDDFLSRFCAIHGVDDDDDDIPVPVAEARDRDLKPRSRSVMKKATMASFEASTVRAKATVKTPSEERRIKAAPRNKVEDSTKLQCSEMDSRAMHNGNKQGVKSVAPATNSLTEAAAAEVVTLRWPLEPTVRPRDFKSREDRPLIPGLTTTDWEKSLQEACLHGEPPANLVLHECLQCGRTFKPESLQVHMRGCRGQGNKQKQRSRASSQLLKESATH